MSNTTSIVLVHGAWLGAWVWRRVLPLLRAAGAESHAVTLTGVGERAHLMSESIDLQTHVQDVIGLIEAEELKRVVLVGHSYAGMVITGVADRLQAAAPGALAHLVYLDAVLPYPGEAWSTPHDEATKAKRFEAAKASGGLHFAPPDAEVFGLQGEDRDWLNRRQTPQPYRLYDQPLDFDGDAVARVPRTFIDCTAPALGTIKASRERVRREPGWNLIEMATGHCPMVSEPEALAAHLLAIRQSTQAGA